MRSSPFVVYGLALAAVAVCAMLGWGLANPGSTMLAPAIVSGPAGRDAVLTFDDGPSVPYTGQILDILRASGIHATFFICGVNAERHPELVRRILAEGHQIGNHTYSHPYLCLKSKETIASEIDRTQDILERITGRRPTLFRPPFGVRWFTLGGLLRQRSLTMVLWSVRAYDGRLDAPGIASEALRQLHPGAIIVLHDGDESHLAVDRGATVRALPAIIAGARRAGYSFQQLAQ